MNTCWACEATLDPAWRFCIRCGTPVERDAPEAAAAPAPAAPLTPLATFAWIMGGIGAAILLGGGVLILISVLT